MLSKVSKMFICGTICIVLVSIAAIVKGSSGCEFGELNVTEPDGYPKDGIERQFNQCDYLLGLGISNILFHLIYAGAIYGLPIVWPVIEKWLWLKLALKSIGALFDVVWIGAGAYLLLYNPGNPLENPVTSRFVLFWCLSGMQIIKWIY